MAKVLPNGAVISNDNEWLWNGLDWQSIGAAADAKRPDRVQTDHAKTLAGGRAGAELDALAAEVLTAVAETGSLVDARRLLSERHASANTAPEVQYLEVEVDPEVLVKTYGSPRDFEADSKEMIRKGWQPENQSTLAGHINVRRTAARVITAGFLIGGASRSKDQLTVTWVRRRTERRKVEPAAQNETPPELPPSTSDIPSQIRKLAELHSQGILTDQEFETKKADLLSRM
jgi:hypothetical protein